MLTMQVFFLKKARTKAPRRMEKSMGTGVEK
jgi:hypothetical protein